MLLTVLAATLMDLGQLDEAEASLHEATILAAASGDHGAEARVLIERHALDYQRATAGAAESVEDLIPRVLPVLEAASDEQGLSRAWGLQAASSWAFGRVSAAAAAWAEAAEHARRGGEEHERATTLVWIAWSTWLGAMEVESAIVRCEEIRSEVRGHPASEAEVLRPLAGLHGFAGRFALARALFAESNDLYDDLGVVRWRALSQTEAVIEMLAGDADRAETLMRQTCDVLAEMGDNARGSTGLALLARALFMQGRYDEAERCAEESMQLADPSDLVTRILSQCVRARLLLARGDHEAAETNAREAVTIAEQTEFVNFRADALVDLAAVLGESPRAADAPPLMAEALALYRAKGNIVSADALHESLDSLAAV